MIRKRDWNKYSSDQRRQGEREETGRLGSVEGFGCRLGRAVENRLDGAKKGSVAFGTTDEDDQDRNRNRGGNKYNNDRR